MNVISSRIMSYSILVYYTVLSYIMLYHIYTVCIKYQYLSYIMGLWKYSTLVGVATVSLWPCPKAPAPWKKPPPQPQV